MAETISENSQVPEQKGDLFAATSPSRQLLDHVSSRWGMLVLAVLLEGTHRFGELRRRIGGISERMLAQTLQALESDGIVVRTVYAVVPPHVEYSLTPMGEEVAFRARLITEWIEENSAEILAIRQQITAEKSAG